MTYDDILCASYFLTDEELESCTNKTLAEINAEAVKMNKYGALVRQMLRDYFSRHLANTDENNPLEVNITIQPQEAFALSSLELPKLTKMWQHPSEGWITFVIDDIKTDLGNIYLDELINIANQFEQDYV